MKKLNSIVVLLGSLSLCLFSCSSAPRAVTQPFSFQEKLESAHHWEILANDFSKQLSMYLEENPLNKIGVGYVVPGVSVPKNPYIYLPTNDISTFGKAFRRSLVTELTRRGYPIAYAPDEAITLRWSVQKIRYNADRKMNRIPGTLTALAALGQGVYKLCSETSVFGATLVAGAFADGLDQGGEKYLFKNMAPKSEINLAITISQNGVLLARQSSIYYVNPEDIDQYAEIPDFEGQKEASLYPKPFIVVNQ